MAEDDAPRCSNPDGRVGDTWEDHDSDDTWILVKKCSDYGNWVTVEKKLKNP